MRLLLGNAFLVHCFFVLGAVYFWCCVFGTMACQLHRAGLLPQWRIYFIGYFQIRDLEQANLSIVNVWDFLARALEKQFGSNVKQFIYVRLESYDSVGIDF